MKAKYDIYILILIAFSILAEPGSAQELTPRAYWPAPKGTMVAVVGYQYSTGDVLIDPSLLLTGLDSRIHVGFLGYLQTFSLFNRTANLIVELPYTWATTTGNIIDPVGETPGKRYVSGLADIGITLSINLIGAPSMTLENFQQLRKTPHQILRASLKILAPTGAYEEDKLINIGSNRWAFKPELGYMSPLAKKWMLELEFGMWFFGDNNEFLGKTRKQDPIFATELHLVRRFMPGFWASLDFNFFGGGRTNLLGEDLQRNSKIGGTIVYPFAGRHAIKGGFSMGVVTESGDNFTTLILGYQVLLN